MPVCTAPSDPHASPPAPPTACCASSRAPLVGRPAAFWTTTWAASFPASTAPSIDPRYFCAVQSPARTKLRMGVSCDGRYLPMPGRAAYTDRGTRTTENLRSAAFPCAVPSPPRAVRASGAISSGNRNASSATAASMISSSDFFSQSTPPEPASGEHGANTSSSIEQSLAYSRHERDMSAYTERRSERLKARPSSDDASLRSNQSCRLMTGMPRNARNGAKKCAAAPSSHAGGVSLLKTSTGTDET
mmetsp:Transcript_40269/g.93979  ORF Transcript_40269/g.93979 Transcript_40269/m.93979 type:complete len:246 (-) Transcript_40269:569-1306(-)